MALYLIPRYFFAYRVTAKDDGEKKLPKRSTAEALRSRLKTEIIDKYQVDVFDACLFPEAAKRWKTATKRSNACWAKTPTSDDSSPSRRITRRKRLTMLKLLRS